MTSSPQSDDFVDFLVTLGASFAAANRTWQGSLQRPSLERNPVSDLFDEHEISFFAGRVPFIQTGAICCRKSRHPGVFASILVQDFPH
jgi:hypothetical protein